MAGGAGAGVGTGALGGAGTGAGLVPGLGGGQYSAAAKAAKYGTINKHTNITHSVYYRILIGTVQL